jgi:hypothetical protein
MHTQVLAGCGRSSQGISVSRGHGLISPSADENQRIAPGYCQSFGLGFFECFQLAEDERAGGERRRREGKGTAGTGPVYAYAEAHFRSRWRRPRASAARIACATISAVTGNGSL